MDWNVCVRVHVRISWGDVLQFGVICIFIRCVYKQCFTTCIAELIYLHSYITSFRSLSRNLNLNLYLMYMHYDWNVCVRVHVRACKDVHVLLVWGYIKIYYVHVQVLKLEYSCVTSASMCLRSQESCVYTFERCAYSLKRCVYTRLQYRKLC